MQKQLQHLAVLFIVAVVPVVQASDARSKVWSRAAVPRCAAALLVGWMGPFHEGREALQRDEAQRSIGMAMQTLMLTARDMGYDSCPMIGFDIDAVAKLINLPGDHVIGPMVAIGKKTKDSWAKPGQLPRA